MAEYHIWSGMKQRCYDSNATSYARYGGKGVTVCKAWRDSFDSFLADMGLRPTARHSIDRIDGTKGYYPENCRWATLFEQSDNKERTHKVLFMGKHRTFREIAILTGIDKKTIAYRWNHKLPLAAKLHDPAKGRVSWNKGKSLVNRRKLCENCKAEFMYKYKSARFCSTSCSAKWRIRHYPHTIQRARNPINGRIESDALFKANILRREP